MNPRYNSSKTNEVKKTPIINKEPHSVSSKKIFGKHIFNRALMKKMLPSDVYSNLIQAIKGKEKINKDFADIIANAMKDWALSLGVTHYTHWFQPLNFKTAEKQDSFIEWKTEDEVIEEFKGAQLIQGEPDASSFPSGGLRSTYEARGYTGWDPTSPVFIWSSGEGLILCIPSIFFSWGGEVLDTKIPLLRSDNLINEATMRLLELTGIESSYAYSTLGCEQEYFLIDRSFFTLRQDLMLGERTVFGAQPAKGQELQDHYLGCIKDRVLCYMRDFEIEALKLGIPVKTRHNEVAPCQYEVAPIYERASLAVDHNIMLMELMRQIAFKHNLVCLLHEKPFAHFNGSGKHCNWSISTDKGVNLLNPTNTPENNLQFIILLTAILNAVYEHAALLRASIASFANDFRLGGHEAPPPIISVYLGKALEDFLEVIETNSAHPEAQKLSYNLGLLVIPDLSKDNTDRNRTSPFAFTGNKFEFRAVGSSCSPAFPMTVLNVIIAKSLNEIVQEISDSMQSTKGKEKSLNDRALPVLRKYLLRSKAIRFSGDNYSDSWLSEAIKRKLPIVEKSFEAFEALKSDSTIKVFNGVLTQQELESRYKIMMETSIHQATIESRAMHDIFRTQTLPATIKYQKTLSDSLMAFKEATGKDLLYQKKNLISFTEYIESSLELAISLEKTLLQTQKIEDISEKGKAFCHKVLPKGEKLREVVDKLETLMDDTLWPLPKYREMLFQG